MGVHARVGRDTSRPSGRVAPGIARASPRTELLGGLVESARDGHGAVIVVLGEPGMGKTALLDHTIDSASDLTVMRAAGVESEMELAFAALHQLCSPVLERLERLPGL